MWELLATGFLGSLHCVGMCGGFVLALDRPASGRWRRVAVQALFHLGKTTTYVLLGGLIGLGGAALMNSAWFPSAQAVLSVVAGCLMILAGLQISGVLGEWSAGALFGPGSLYQRAFQAALNIRSPIAPFVTGSLTGFLPCPLVYAFLAAALQTGSVLPAMGTMAILGLASMPALILVAVAGAKVGPAARKRIIRIAGIVVILLGIITVLRGVAPDLLHGDHGDGHDHSQHHRAGS